MTTLLSKISWSNHLAIVSKAKTPVEHHFYMSLCVKENYSARELSRQIDSVYYECLPLSNEKAPSAIESKNMKKFLFEFGRDFLFIDEEYHIQVQNSQSD